MLGVEELKEEIEITKTKVECPVKGCSKEVDRKYRKDTHKYTAEFKCQTHNIFISPSTFKYENESENLLWKDQSDRELLKRIKAPKRESRFAHDNSEDAVSWNVFRFLERNNLTEGFLGLITDTSPRSSEVIYWSYSQREDNGWSLLDRARRVFGERSRGGSEPDIIVKSDNALFFIEAKLTAGNTKYPSNPSYSKIYETLADNWFSKVFESDYETIALVERKYELMRFWLLGTWMAEQLDLDFYLINLVLSKRERNIEAIFKKHIKENQRRRFLRVTWESIQQFIAKRSVYLDATSPFRDREIMMRYFRNKTIGYPRRKKIANGIFRSKLRKAFSING
ncbi:MAG: PGN_0703 family putative restriction endonuclease [Candidatus Thorarchaeota archaeon]|jgi:hypothetical protein